MSIYTTTTVKRGTTTITTGLPVQIDNASLALAQYYGGANPFDAFDIYIRYTQTVINRSDHLMDENTIDPLTSTNVTYLVINIPESFPDGHTELRVNRMAGA